MFHEVVAVVKKWDKIGLKETSTGTKLIGAVPHIGSMAYLHSIYAPLTEDEIAVLEQEINNELPTSLKEFYRFANGCNLFQTLEINGLRKNYDRSLDDNAYQPISLKYQNVFNQPLGKTDDCIFFGAYDWDGSCLFMRKNERKVFLCLPDNVDQILYEWPGFEEFLLGEVKRLANMFDDNGRQYDEDQQTTPNA